MDNQSIVHARDQAQRALALARLAKDPDLKQQWLAVADSWSALVTALQRQAAPDGGPSAGNGRSDRR
jgi:hypothetical protein